MRALVLLALVFLPALAFAEFQDNVSACEMMVYSPSFELLIDKAKGLMKRFYGKNYEQMLEQVRGESKSTYGVDILNLKSLESAGIAVDKPVCYVHISNETGYLLVSANNRKTLETFIKSRLSGSAYYRFFDNVVALSEKKEVVDSLTNMQKISDTRGFQLSAQRLGFGWKTMFGWVESRYLSAVSQSIGVSGNIRLPYGFTAMSFEFNEKNVLIRNYSGLFHESQPGYIQAMRQFGGQDKFVFADYVWGNPAVVGTVHMNVPMLYRYYSAIDQINILGLKGLIQELGQKYRINVERDLINNCDGRVNLVIDRLDTQKNEYVVYGSLGVRNEKVAETFIESMKGAALATSNKLYSFDLFTKNFYHYASSNYSLYYGVVENELLFSTGKEVMQTLVRNIFEDNRGNLTNMPGFFQDAVTNRKPGYFLKVDAQSLFANVRTGFQFNRELMMGVEAINIYGNPDLGNEPYGWNTTIDIQFYK